MNRDLIKGMALGAGLVVVAPYLAPFLARAAKPAVGAAVKAGVAAWDRGRESFAEMSEYAEDMLAEARAERERPAAAEEAAAAASPPSGGNGAG